VTQNTKSLNDVMRLLYWKYYKQLQRGFTDAEFQQACESIAGIPLTELFEYVSTTKALDYTAYLNLAGLKLETKEGVMNGDNPKKQTFNLIPVGTPDGTQQAILRSWLNH
jgi:predicted metalloprotease with PDZ domain